MSKKPIKKSDQGVAVQCKYKADFSDVKVFVGRNDRGMGAAIDFLIASEKLHKSLGQDDLQSAPLGDPKSDIDIVAVVHVPDSYPDSAVEVPHHGPSAGVRHSGSWAEFLSPDPGIAEFLFALFLTGRDAEAQIGCLNEKFTRNCKKYGRCRAIRLYWAELLKVLWPQLTRAIGKAVKWGAILAVAKRLAGL